MTHITIKKKKHTDLTQEISQQFKKDFIALAQQIEYNLFNRDERY